MRPRDPNLYLNRGIAYFNKSEYGKAISDYDDALKLDPKLTPALNNRCLTRAVMGANLDAALADCNEVLRLVPDDPYAHDNIGLIYLKRKQWDRAIAQYNASLKVDPDRARALYGRGLARARNGQGPAGIADMSTASGIQPNISNEFTKYGVN